MYSNLYWSIINTNMASMMKYEIWFANPDLSDPGVTLPKLLIMVKRQKCLVERKTEHLLLMLFKL